MKKIVIALAAFGMAALPQVAHAMECCKDGKCACCKKEEGEPQTKPEQGHENH